MSEIFGEALDDELSSLALELERIRDLGDAVGNTLTRSLRNAILEGRSLQSLLGDIGRAFADIALKAALKPFGTLMSGGVESIFTALNPALGGVAALGRGEAAGYMPRSGGWELPSTGPAESAASPPSLFAGSSPAGNGMTVNFNITTSDARSFVAAEAEINAILLRAARRGGRGN